MTTQFEKIYHGLSPDAGKFRVAESGMAWRNDRDNNQVTVSKAEIKWAQWLRVARNFQLRIGKANHQMVTFEGFMRDDHERIAKILKNLFAITLETKDISFKGWNWGLTDFQGHNKLAFTVSDRTAFELPLDQVGNTNIAGRTEVSLELNPPSATNKIAGDELMEIRFYVPGTTSKNKGSDVEDVEDDDEEQSAAQAFHETIKDKADIGQVQGDVILSFEDVLVLTPRGRYDMDMYSDFLRLRGKTYDYKILHTSISRLFLLPKDDLHVLFILGLDIPIRQGQTRYQYLVMQFSREEETTATLNMSDEEVEKHDRLKKTYEDPTFEVVSSIFRALASKKIIGVGTFTSASGQPGYKANLKAVQGDLFLLEKYIFFVSKSPLLIEFATIHSVVCSRVGAGGVAAARTFDLRVVTKDGPEHVFSSINKEEHELTETFLRDKKVRVKNEMADQDIMMKTVVDIDDDDDDDDDDMQSVRSEDSGPRTKKKVNMDDDEDSEVDEDFAASSSDSGSPSESDSSSGGAATASDASGDRDFTKGKKKKTKKAGDAPAKSKKGKEKVAGNDDVAMDSDADAPKQPKAAPKKKTPKKKSEDDMDVDVEEVAADKPKAKPKPKPKPKAAAAADGEGGAEKPKAKPKPKPKEPTGEEDEPPKKKAKKSD